MMIAIFIGKVKLVAICIFIILCDDSTTITSIHKIVVLLSHPPPLSVLIVRPKRELSKGSNLISS
jgi:hypothetical protein